MTTKVREPLAGPGGPARIDDIEILRAVAIVLVIILHLKFNLFSWKSQSLWFFSDCFGSGRGVDLFFVISGFVIARTLLPQLQAASGGGRFCQAMTAFWIRRVWRIVPAAWVCIAVSLVLMWAFNQSGALGTVKGNLIAAAGAILNVANYVFKYLFGNNEYRNILFVHWSLSLEMQFYLLLPLIVLLSRRFLTPVLILAAVVLTAAHHRSDSLVIGVLLAIWATHPSHRMSMPAFLKKGSRGTAALVLIYIGLAAFGYTRLPRAERLDLGTGVCVVAVFIASHDMDVLINSPGARKVMLWIGSRSYSLYLWHIVAFASTREIFFRLGYRPLYTLSDGAVAIFAAMGIGSCLLLAEASYRFVEVPFRRRGRRIARNWSAGVTALASGESGRAMSPE